jgi:DNA-binding CsgD family transcriptional regulator
MKSVSQQKLVVEDRSMGGAPSPIPTAPTPIVRGSASLVIVSDEHRRVVALNSEAESLFGVSASDAAAPTCDELIRGRDRSGNELRLDAPDVARPAFDVDLVAGNGDVIPAVCSVFVLREGSLRRIVHVLTLATGLRDVAGVPSPAGDRPERTGGAKAANAIWSLTCREHDVLRLLAQGNDSLRIAELLFISLATVRNHIHNILRKMNVHSQVEAVAMAYRNQLL